MLGPAMCLLLLAAAGANTTTENYETFETVEKNWKSTMGSLIRKILPYLLKGGSDANISGACTASFIRIVGGVRNLREWAIRFIDATGKIPPGILEGTSLSIGDYDECLDIEVGRRDEIPKTPEEVVFRGQYCLLESHRPEGINRAIQEYQNGNKDTAIAKTKTFLNMFIRYKHLTNSTAKFGVCVPSKCSKEDVQKLLNSDALSFLGKISVAYCEMKTAHKYTAEQIFLLCVLCFALVLTGLGTLVDTIVRIREPERDLTTATKMNYVLQVARTTSWYTNALQLVNTTKGEEHLQSLCALRPLIVILTIYSHTYGHLHILHFQKYNKAANFLKFFESFTFSGIANGSVGMDTVVFLAGVTITYYRWRFVSAKSKANLRLVPLILQRYIRMSVAQLLVIGLFLLFPLSGSGPIWSAYVGPIIQNCQQRWWLNILYIGNFWKPTEMCLYHTWILAVIMQLTVVSIFILLLLRWSMRYGIFFMAALIVAGIIGVGVMTVVNELPGSLAFFMLDIRTAVIAWRDIYILAYDHVGAFCIGLLTGLFLANKKDELHISKVTSTVMWCLSIACNSAVIFGLYSYRHGESIDLALGAFYAVMHRNVWGLGIAWLVIACTTRHAGAVGRVLHSKFFIPFDRLCYIAFLMHMPIMYYHSGSLRERWFMGHLEMMFMAIGYIVLSFVTSFFLNIIFARPYFALEEKISSCFHSKNKVTFESTRTVPSLISTNSKVDGIVNGAYSKNVDGL